jgi:hypothetical protein
MKYEIVDIGFKNSDEFGFAGYENMVVGLGEDFFDAAIDASNLFSDLTNLRPLAIMLKIVSAFPEKANTIGPADTIDSKKNKQFYSLGIRYTQ